MYLKNLFFSLVVGLALTVYAADSQQKTATKEIEIKKDTVQVSESKSSSQTMKKTTGISTEKTNWSKIKDLFM